MVISTLILLILAALLALAAVEDARRLVIPNRLPIAIALLFPAYALAAPDAVDVLGSLQFAAISFAAGFVLFVLRIVGGGDAKLFAAVALWAGPPLFASFALVTAVTGAVIALAMLTIRRFAGSPAPAPSAAGSEAAAVRALRRAELPYGVAIAAGGLAVVVMHLIGE
jgi:prepilin peptidase CpaA